MKFAPKNRSKPASFALTSMLDVIFLLLCFFVTASVFSQWESEISIQLPNATTADEPSRLPGEIIVNIREDGSIRVNGFDLPLFELGQRLEKIARFYPGQSVIIRGDRAASYESIVKVVDTCRSAGVWNFSLSTSNQEDAAKDRE